MWRPPLRRSRWRTCGGRGCRCARRLPRYAGGSGWRHPCQNDRWPVLRHQERRASPSSHHGAARRPPPPNERWPSLSVRVSGSCGVTCWRLRRYGSSVLLPVTTWVCPRWHRQSRRRVCPASRPSLCWDDSRGVPSPVQRGQSFRRCRRRMLYRRTRPCKRSPPMVPTDRRRASLCQWTCQPRYPGRGRSAELRAASPSSGRRGRGCYWPDCLAHRRWGWFRGRRYHDRHTAPSSTAGSPCRRPSPATTNGLRPWPRVLPRATVGQKWPW